MKCRRWNSDDDFWGFLFIKPDRVGNQKKPKDPAAQAKGADFLGDLAFRAKPSVGRKGKVKEDRDDQKKQMECFEGHRSYVVGISGREQP